MVGAVVVAAALASGGAGTAVATAAPISGSIVKNADGSYTLQVTSSVTGFDEVNLILPNGSTYKLVQGAHCALQSPTTIDCTPVQCPSVRASRRSHLRPLLRSERAAPSS
jgi:hypothetical protein